MPHARIAFIASKFPSYDEAFILRELYAFSKEMAIVIFSLRRANDKIIHDQARELLGQTLYLPYLLSREVLTAQLRFLIRKPAVYFRALARLVCGNLRSPEFLLKSLIFFPKAVAMADWILENGVTHIHACWATYPASVAMVISELTGIPFSISGHAHDIYLDTTHLRQKIRKAAFISTCTRSNKTYLESLVPEHPPERITVDYHGLCLDHFCVNGKKRKDVFQILSVGTLHYYKGFDYLIDGLSELRNRGLSFHCTIIGGGPLESDIRRHIRLLDLEPFVTMTGALKQKDVIPHYHKADLLVLMAQREWHWGIPNVIIEALAAKAAVVTTRFGSVEELIEDGRTGLLVEAKNPSALADAVQRLYDDDALRVRLAEEGHKRVAESFDIKKSTKVFGERFGKEQRSKK